MSNSKLRKALLVKDGMKDYIQSEHRMQAVSNGKSSKIWILSMGAKIMEAALGCLLGEFEAQHFRKKHFARAESNKLRLNYDGWKGSVFNCRVNNGIERVDSLSMRWALYLICVPNLYAFGNFSSMT